jgi:AraC-like DNA-binding protein
MLHTLFAPITARPFSNQQYAEILPGPLLKPYIRCFWSATGPEAAGNSDPSERSLVVPDTCMDIVFEKNMRTGRITDRFYGINNRPFWATRNPGTSVFAIRFYFWTVPFFADAPMTKTLNVISEIQAYFSAMRQDFLILLQKTSDLRSPVRTAEDILLRKLNGNKQNSNVLNAVYRLLKTKGRSRISTLSADISVSRRHLERLFLEFCGASPKTIARLIRYQFLWQEIVKQEPFDVQDAVYSYGFTDQSHLLKEFIKLHSLTPARAKSLAYSGFY